MTSYTDEYGLSKIGPNEDWTAQGWKFSMADRDTIARLLKLGAESHHHTGAAPVVQPTTRALTLAINQTAGNIPAGTTVRYKYTFVDVLGFETAPSTEYSVTTPTEITAPAAGVLSTQTTGGTLLPGNYYYVLTAYTTVNTQETKALAPNYITIPIGTATNKVTITLPSVPAGASGFNIYVKKPGEVRYNYLASVAMGGATPPLTYVDNGSVAENCNRTIPTANTTNGHNTINITLGGGALPSGTTWKLYRTYISNYDNSFLHHVVEETYEGSGVITQAYSDTGTATFAGGPPVASQAIGTPSKVDLQDGNEVRRALPMGLVAGFPVVHAVHFPGAVAFQQQKEGYVVEFPDAIIVGVRAALGPGFKPASQELIVDVNLTRYGATPVTTSIFTNQNSRPRISVGQQVGNRVAPQIFDLNPGDMLTFDVDQTGGGATPTDRDLTITVYMVVKGYSQVTSWTGGVTLP